MSIPRIVISAAGSGCGKTTVTTGIMAALVKRGLKVQAFKVGPDYIDPMFHTSITSCHSRNLDSWMLQEETVSYLFQRSSTGKDIAVIEGVMGLYDGFGGREDTGSTAHVSRIIAAPVVLVIDGDGMSLSIAALIQGFKNFDPSVNVRGVILNNIKSEGHYKFLKNIIEDNTGLCVAGYLPRRTEYMLESRHLGLVPDNEVNNLKQKLEFLAEQVEETIDIELLLRISREAGNLSSSVPFFINEILNIQGTISTKKRIRLAVAMDKAFNFYYKDNLELLEMLGAELVYFSPLKDVSLPESIHGIYIGGGFPEEFAHELENNTDIKKDISRHIESGLPAYAECGGLMYMSRSIKDKKGQIYKMLGMIPGNCEMTASLQRFGYIELQITEDNVIAAKGSTIRAHEFHYSSIKVEEAIPACYKVTKSRGITGNSVWPCGYRKNNLLAGYPHIHFWSNWKFARQFIESCSCRAEQLKLGSE